MRITSFASGSSGNCSLISYAGTHILIDTGISLKRITACLLNTGLSPADITAVFITHTHTDHICGLQMVTKRHKLPVYASRPAANTLRRTIIGIEEHILDIRTGEAIDIGGFSVVAFNTSHDSPGSVGYRIDGDGSFGYCTDLGYVSDEVTHALTGVDMVMLEANHDLEMLRNGSYPFYLKRRVSSKQGHLSNDDCADFAVLLAQTGTTQIILSHLSRENNTPAIATRTVEAALLKKPGLREAVSLGVAPVDESLTIFQEKPACLA